jgi:hypothetical protein
MRPYALWRPVVDVVVLKCLMVIDLKSRRETRRGLACRRDHLPMTLGSRLLLFLLLFNIHPMTARLDRYKTVPSSCHFCLGIDHDPRIINIAILKERTGALLTIHHTSHHTHIISLPNLHHRHHHHPPQNHNLAIPATFPSPLQPPQAFHTQLF